MSYREVDSTCVVDISQYEFVPANNSPSEKTELSLLFDGWTTEVKPFLEKRSEPIESIPPPHQGFTFEGTLRIDGHVKGALPSGDGTLIVGKQGHCEADAFVGRAFIEGTVDGNIQASELIRIGAEARVIGDIEAPSISIGRGAVFDGQCRMLKTAEMSQKPDENSDHGSISFSYDAEHEDLEVAIAG